MRTFTTSLLATVALTFVAAASATAQPRVTIADYERAERFMTYNTTPLVSNGAVRANWLPDDRFWYRNQTAAGSEFILVDAARGTKAPAFDHARVAAALSTALGRTINASRLPFQQITFDDTRQRFSFDSDGTCGLADASDQSGSPGAPLDPQPAWFEWEPKAP